MLPDNFSRYLQAKKTVDDRSLNLWVYQKLLAALAAAKQTTALRVLEIGCGIGTMVERLWDRGLAVQATYTAIDREPELIAEAQRRLQEFARHRCLEFSGQENAVRLAGNGQEWLIALTTMDYEEFCQSQGKTRAWDLLLAHAFLDLVDLDLALPQLLSLLRPGGWYYFTLNFDGQTIFQPPCDPQFESQMIYLYHQTMDQRQGRFGGQSRTGRRLLHALCQTSVVLAAGSSDWLVWPSVTGSYPAEEAYFLTFILDTMNQVVGSHSDLDQERFRTWLARRQTQVESGELIFLAHQIDLCGQRP